MRNKISRTIYNSFSKKLFFSFFGSAPQRAPHFFFQIFFSGEGRKGGRGAIGFGERVLRFQKATTKIRSSANLWHSFKKELLQLSCALQLRKIIIDHSEEKRNFVLYFWEKNLGLEIGSHVGRRKKKVSSTTWIDCTGVFFNGAKSGAIWERFPSPLNDQYLSHRLRIKLAVWFHVMFHFVEVSLLLNGLQNGGFHVCQNSLGKLGKFW